MTEPATIEELARAADDAGARLADGINDMAERLAPRQVVDDALTAVRTRGTALARDAGGFVKTHPLVAGAAVAAIGLAVYAGRRISTAELDIERDIEGYTDYDDSVLDAAASAPAVATDPRAIVRENPVVSILAGLAAGAALAMLFPSSTAERRSLGALARRMTSR